MRGTDRPARWLLHQFETHGTPWHLPLPCLQEVLQGARDDGEWRRLHAGLAGQRVVRPTDDVAVHVEGARIYYDCRRQGITVRSTMDCWIAALVLQVDGTLVHDDEDYRRIAQVRPLKWRDGP